MARDLFAEDTEFRFMSVTQKTTCFDGYEEVEEDLEVTLRLRSFMIHDEYGMRYFPLARVKNEVFYEERRKLVFEVAYSYSDRIPRRQNVFSMSFTFTRPEEISVQRFCRRFRDLVDENRAIENRTPDVGPFWQWREVRTEEWRRRPMQRYWRYRRLWLRDGENRRMNQEDRRRRRERRDG